MTDRAMQTCMLERVGTTVDRIESLRSPVARSCHIGNNTSNIWGWLGFVQNARLLEYDHTLYGVDENCCPWLVLGPNGRVEASYSFRGESQPGQVGCHVNEVIDLVPSKYRSILNYGIFAEHGGQDLMRFHIENNRRLAQAANGSDISFDSAELLAHPDLLTATVEACADRQTLGRLFNRWVRRSRSGHVVVVPLREIVCRGRDSLTLTAVDGEVVFDGSTKQLLEHLFGGLGAVVDRLEQGTALGRIGYPWVSLSFSYLWTAVVERWRDPTQDRFWHVGGSASQYYVNSVSFVSQVLACRAGLVEVGFLPSDAQVELIPSFCLQLFATTREGADILTKIVEIWRWILQGREDLQQLGIALGATESPLSVVGRFVHGLDCSRKFELRTLLDAFNRCDHNQLPVAHVVGIDDPTYNKYGAAQNDLTLDAMYYPPVRDMQWFELELLVKTLAELTRGQFG